MHGGFENEKYPEWNEGVIYMLLMGSRKHLLLQSWMLSDKPKKK